MLMDDVERYLALRRSLGYRLHTVENRLNAFAEFAARRDETHVVAATVVAWTAEARSANARYCWYRDVRRFAEFTHAEDPQHQVPPRSPYRHRYSRRPPHVYSHEEIVRIMLAARELEKHSFPLRVPVYSTLFGLLAATGLRISEALQLRVGDLHPGGILHIRWGKCGKSRFVPLHPTAEVALQRYLRARRQIATEDDHLFLSASNQGLSYIAVWTTFQEVVCSAGIALDGGRRVRMHDFRHTFATRGLEQCSNPHASVSRHFLAMATYLGHVDVSGTYWYLRASPQLMTDIAKASESLMHGGQA